MPYGCDRNRLGGGVIVYVRDDIPNKQFMKHKLPEDMEGVFVEVNFKKNEVVNIWSISNPVPISRMFF